MHAFLCNPYNSRLTLQRVCSLLSIVYVLYTGAYSERFPRRGRGGKNLGPKGDGVQAGRGVPLSWVGKFSIF